MSTPCSKLASKRKLPTPSSHPSQLGSFLKQADGRIHPQIGFVFPNPTSVELASKPSYLFSFLSRPMNWVRSCKSRSPHQCLGSKRKFAHTHFISISIGFEA